MTGLNHAATGALVAVAVKQPALALPLAFLSHFAIDAIPHWTYRLTGSTRKIALSIDLISSLSLLGILALVLTTPGWLVIACGFLCMLPDAMWFPGILYRKPPKPDKSNLLGYIKLFHRKIQNEFDNGFYVEAAWFGAVLALILKIGR